MTFNVLATLNPSDKGAGISLSNGNRTANGTGSARTFVKVSSGKWYFEVTRATSSAWAFGVANSTAALTQFPGGNTNSMGLLQGSIYYSSVQENVVALATTGVFGVALDADARTIRFFNASGTTTSRALGFSGDIYIALGASSAGLAGGVTLNVGQAAFTYSVPSGFTGGFALRTVYGIAGNVKDAAGANAARTLRAYLRSTGVMTAETVSDGTTGDYLLVPEPNTTDSHQVVVLPVSTSENALILDRMVPG